MNKDEIEVSELFQVFNENCSNQLLRQTIKYNPEPNAIKAAQLVLQHRCGPKSSRRGEGK